MVTVIRPSRARCVKATIPRHERAVLTARHPARAGRHAGDRPQRIAAWGTLGLAFKSCLLCLRKRTYLPILELGVQPSFSRARYGGGSRFASSQPLLCDFPDQARDDVALGFFGGLQHLVLLGGQVKLDCFLHDRAQRVRLDGVKL